MSFADVLRARVPASTSRGLFLWIDYLKRLCYTPWVPLNKAVKESPKMEKKILKVIKSRRVQCLICATRGVLGEALLAGLAVAYVAEHINQVPHQAGVGVGLVIVGLLLYFTHANKIK